MSNRILFFGGSFDPVHHGHLIVARAVAEQAGAAKIVLVPARQSPHKDRIHASAQDRLAMLRLAAQGQEMFDISDIELARTGPSYTIDTLVEFRRRHGDAARLAWVIGADMLADLPRWRRAKELVEQFEVVVASRTIDAPALEAAFANIEKSFGPDRARKLRAAVVANPLIEISSTDIRARIAARKSIDFLVPPAVAQYIREKRLYRN